MEIDEEFKQSCISIGKNVKNYRMQKRLSISDLSQKTGISQNYIRKIENGTAYGMYMDKHLNRIATVLEIKLSNLLDENL